MTRKRASPPGFHYPFACARDPARVAPVSGELTNGQTSNRFDRAAVMGRNLALNIESRGYAVSVYNRSREKTDELIAEFPGRNLVPTYTLEEFVASLETPRRILMMVKAGEATDATIASLKPLLEKGDVLIDGGNTHFTDTIRRNQEPRNRACTSSAPACRGRRGALRGPSIMPGGQRDAYDLVEPILKQIAAKAPSDGEPCVAYM